MSVGVVRVAALLALTSACNPSFDPEWSVKVDSGPDQPGPNGEDAAIDAGNDDAGDEDAGSLLDAGSDGDAVVLPIPVPCSVENTCAEGDAGCTKICKATCPDACLATRMCVDASICSIPCMFCDNGVIPPI